jgi:hypothetical protein
MQRWRRTVGALLILAPIWAICFYVLTGVFLGSMGMDIHWNSKAVSHAATTSIVLILLACVAAGIKLRKSPVA